MVQLELEELAGHGLESWKSSQAMDWRAMGLKKFRPIGNLSTGYKLCAAEVAERMSRTFEEYGVWHDFQEGAMRGRSSKRQIYKLISLFRC